jgi:hypothetical protein
MQCAENYCRKLEGHGTDYVGTTKYAYYNCINVEMMQASISRTQVPQIYFEPVLMGVLAKLTCHSVN